MVVDDFNYRRDARIIGRPPLRRSDCKLAKRGFDLQTKERSKLNSKEKMVLQAAFPLLRCSLHPFSGTLRRKRAKKSLDISSLQR